MHDLAFGAIKNVEIMITITNVFSVTEANYYYG